MSELIIPTQNLGATSWWYAVSPRAEEMPDFLKVIAQGWRTPKKKWEDLWRLRRGDVNHILGVRRFDLCRPKKYQRGMVAFVAVYPYATGPNTLDIAHEQSSVAPTSSRVHIRWNSDGYIEYYSGSATSGFSYTTLTTQTDDSNDHTLTWWPAQPETNEGLNWDLRYINDATTGTPTKRWQFNTANSTTRTESTWYLLDTVSNSADTDTRWGSWGVNRSNAGPSTGTGTSNCDVEIRATGTGAAVTSQACDLTVTGT
jgi:hypothetical protein